MTLSTKNSRSLARAILARMTLALALVAGSLLLTNSASADHLSVTVGNNDIRINGDFLANVMTVSILTEARAQTCRIKYSGTIEVRGAEATIDARRKTATFEVARYIDDLRIYTHGGHDSITVRNFRALGSNGDLIVDSGDEFDDILVENSQARDIILIGGTGDDDLEVRNSDATGWIAIRGQEGGNTITAAGCSASNMGLRGGDERDTITADYVAANSLYIFGYEGNDFIELGHFVESNNSLPTLNVDHLEIDTAEGNDQIWGHYINVSSMFIETGAGADDIFLPIIEGNLLDIDAGSGSDLVAVGGMVSELSSSSLHIDAGSGNDTVELGYGATPIDFNLGWMEVRLGSGSDDFYNYVNGLVDDYVWNGGSGIDSHWFVPIAGGWYADPWKTLNFE